MSKISEAVISMKRKDKSVRKGVISVRQRNIPPNKAHFTLRRTEILRPISAGGELNSSADWRSQLAMTSPAERRVVGCDDATRHPHAGVSRNKAGLVATQAEVIFAGVHNHRSAASEDKLGRA